MRDLQVVLEVGSIPTIPTKKKFSIDTNLNIISVYEIDGSLSINAENTPSEKKLNDFKIVTYEPNIYGTLLIQYKMKNLLQKIKKDD